MSGYDIVFEAGKALKKILHEEFEKDAALKAAVPGIDSDQAITFTNPVERQNGPAANFQLSLWLYMVAENEFVKNRRPLRLASAGEPAVPPQAVSRVVPLALNLHYLVTPIAGAGQRDQLVLGKAMQVLYDNAIVALVDSGHNIAEELHIQLCRLTLEELTRVWEALREPYHLSVCYQVSVVRVDSVRESRHARIIERSSHFTDSLQAAG